MFKGLTLAARLGEGHAWSVVTQHSARDPSAMAIMACLAKVRVELAAHSHRKCVGIGIARFRTNTEDRS